MKTLYLIDGYAQFFRAYHAIRTPLSSPVTKEPTNMTFGFVGTLFKLLRGEGAIGGAPDAVAVAIDVSDDRGTFRSQIYPEYKAHRPPIPEDLPVQIDRCLAMLREVGIPIVGAAGFEADDVIATIVSRLRRERPDWRIRIVSKDKDLKQLLEPVFVEMYDINTDGVIDAAALKADAGIEPRQVIDMLALMGDTVDNVPGVDGIGPKTAAQLIAQYGTLDALIADAGSIKGKRGENLRAALGQLPLARELVTLRHDAPVEFSPAAASPDRFHLERLGPVLRELGFNRYQDELKALLGQVGGEPTPMPALPGAPDGGGSGARAGGLAEPSGGLFDVVEAERGHAAEARDHYVCVRTREELEALVQRLGRAPVFAVDTETTSLAPRRAKLCGISFAVAPGSGWYVPVRSPTPEQHLDEATVLAALRPLLEDPAKPKYGHNIKYDLLVFRNAGIELRGLEHPESCDSMVASFLIDSGRPSHGMDALALSLLKYATIPISDLIGSGKNQATFDAVPIARATEYAAEDADITFRLCDLMRPQLRAMGLTTLSTSLEMPLVPVLGELEWNGVLVDPDELDRQNARLAGRIEALRREIQDAAMESVGRTFDPDSPKQLGAVLFNKVDAGEPGLGLTPIKRNKTGPSTDAEVLEKIGQDETIESPIPRLILEYRQLTKLVNTYLVALKEAIEPATGRIHASFHQTVAVTGRLASSDPNLQNIPIRTDLGREIRKAFVAPPGKVLITADYSQIELRLLGHLSRDPGLMQAFHEGADIHTAVAAQIHGIPPGSVTKAQRSGAKMVNFGIVYGITAFGLARRLNISNAEAAEIIAGYKKRFAGITTFLEECVAQARRYGYVETMMKRRRPIPDIDSTNPTRKALAERTAINSVVQGSAADLIKIAMVDLYSRLSPHAEHLRAGRGPEIPGVDMILQIHDELVFEAPADAAEAAKALIVSRMEHAMTLTVPLVADAAFGRNWFEGK
ncbi:MAG: DNA polymerase I [Phycisphaerales bacterium]|nr:DNA polymerase I [Phycisphaerales bacterium]